MGATTVFTDQNVLNNDKFTLQLITEYDVQISYSTSKLRALQCVHFNLLQPTGHVMRQQFNIQQLYLLPTLYLCSAFI